MEYYDLLPEPEETKRFLELLPMDYSLNECLTVALFARKKYVRDIPELSHISLSNDDGCWDRTIVHQTLKDRENDFSAKVYRSILSYCRPKGAWVDRNELPMPEEVLALYMSINPRCAIKGTRELHNDLIEKCFLPTSSKEAFVGDLYSNVKTVLQKNISRKLIADVDIDIKDIAVLNAFRDIIRTSWNAEVCTIETRGGYHILADMEKMKNANEKWYTTIESFVNNVNLELGAPLVEFKTDTLAPIVGSRQGGFVVRMI